MQNLSSLEQLKTRYKTLHRLLYKQCRVLRALQLIVLAYLSQVYFSEDMSRNDMHPDKLINSFAQLDKLFTRMTSAASKLKIRVNSSGIYLNLKEWQGTRGDRLIHLDTMYRCSSQTMM